MKKVLSIVLAAVLAIGMTTVGFAAVGSKITGISNTFVYGINTPLGASSTNGTAGGGHYDMGEIEPDTQLRLYLNQQDFTWQDASGAAATEYPGTLSSSHLSGASIKVAKSNSKGSSAIKDVSLKYDSSAKQMYILVEFVKELTSTKDVDFQFTLYLTKRGTRQSNTALTVSGTMRNDVIELDTGDDYVDLSDGSVAEALGYVRNIEVYAGNGVYVTANMYEGSKYYCYTNQELSSSDANLLDKNPEIDSVIYLKTNLTGSRKVKIDTGDTYYVYNADGKYLGTTNDTLAYSSKYYLASKRIDLNTGSVSESSSSSSTGATRPAEDAGAARTGSGTSVNENDNPGTGANPLVNVAVIAGAAALITAIAAGLKKKK